MRGVSTKELLEDYDAILIPNWVSEEICDSIYRKDYIERLYAAGLPIYSIAEESPTIHYCAKCLEMVCCPLVKLIP